VKKSGDSEAGGGRNRKVYRILQTSPVGRQRKGEKTKGSHRRHLPGDRGGFSGDKDRGVGNDDADRCGQKGKGTSRRRRGLTKKS